MFGWIKKFLPKPKQKVQPLPQVNTPAAPTPAPAEPGPRKRTPWGLAALKWKGRKETDPEFEKVMVPFWPAVGLRLKTIKEDWAAWCGLFVGACLITAGMSHQPDGSLARNWGKYGVAINWKVDGLPQDAIVWVNNKGDCSNSKNNHVTMANGDCTAEDLLKRGATFDGLGGNQNNQVKVSTYAVSKICAVRWPAEFEKPPKITKSVNCTSGSSGSESTR